MSLSKMRDMLKKIKLFTVDVCVSYEGIRTLTRYSPNRIGQTEVGTLKGNGYFLD